LQNSLTPTPDTPYIDRRDEEEAKRLREATGLGEINFLDTEDIKKYSIQDYGFNLEELS